MRNKKLIILFSVLLSLTLLVVFNSVLFSVQHVYASCANVEDSSLASEVIANHGIKRGSSIFFVNKNKVSANVESKVPRVRVLNIEKSFPNRIYINYVEVRVYVKVSDGMRNYYLGNDMRVMPNDDGEKAIELKLGVSLPELKDGDTFTYESQSGVNTYSVVTEIFAGLERCGYYRNDVVGLFDEIDLTGKFIKMKTHTGMSCEILNPDGLADKLRLALSIYFSGSVDVHGGTLIITGANKASYRADDGTVSGV